MADTVRNESALLALFADNDNEDISPQDLRDLVVSADVDGTTVHVNSTSNPHSTSFSNIGSGTIAELNAVISDGTVSTGFDFDVVTGTSQAMSAGSMYVANNDSTQIDFSLPASPNTGDSFLIVGLGTAGWKVTSGAANQYMTISGSDSTASAAAGVDLAAHVSATDKIWIVYKGNDQFEAVLHEDGSVIENPFQLQTRLAGEGTNGNNAGDRFGYSVDVSGDTCIIGATYQAYDASGGNFEQIAGAAYIFVRSAGIWSLEQKIVGEGVNGRDGFDTFGESVSIDGDTCIVGAPGHDYDENGDNFVSSAGAAFVYTRSGSTWTLEQKLVGSGTNGRHTNAKLGLKVAVHNDTCVMGSQSYSYNDNGSLSMNQAGIVYVFTRSGSTWTLQQKIAGLGSSGTVAFDNFGASLDLYDDTLVVGAPSHNRDENGTYTGKQHLGTVNIIKRTGSTWALEKKLVGTNAYDYYGYSCSIHGDTVAVGSRYHDFDAVEGDEKASAGAVYIYTRSGVTWTSQQKLVASGTNGRNASDYFGAAIELSTDVCAIGSPGHAYDGDGADSQATAGAAWVFERDGSTWSLSKKLVASGTNGRNTTDEFGEAIAIDGTTCVIGVPNYDFTADGSSSLSGAGTAFIFV